MRQKLGGENRSNSQEHEEETQKREDVVLARVGADRAK